MTGPTAAGTAGTPVAAASPGLARFSLNQRTVPAWSIPEVLDALSAAGAGGVGLWREPVHEFGLERTVRLVRDHGLRVSTLCRGGFLTGADPGDRRVALEDNRRAIDEAAALGAACLVMVVGGMQPGDRDLAGTRARAREAIAELAPYAGERGVQLALEALHPMYVADRAVLSTLDQALDWAEDHPPEQVGVVVDTYHQWWDPNLDAALRRASGRIATYQICDWILPLASDVLLARGLMGRGYADIPAMTAAVAAAGFAGDIEVEIFNQDLWDAPPAEAFAQVVEAFLSVVR